MSIAGQVITRFRWYPESAPSESEVEQVAQPHLPFNILRGLSGVQVLADDIFQSLSAGRCNCLVVWSSGPQNHGEPASLILGDSCGIIVPIADFIFRCSSVLTSELECTASMWVAVEDGIAHDLISGERLFAGNAFSSTTLASFEEFCDTFEGARCRAMRDGKFPIAFRLSLIDNGRQTSTTALFVDCQGVNAQDIPLVTWQQLTSGTELTSQSRIWIGGGHDDSELALPALQLLLEEAQAIFPCDTTQNKEDLTRQQGLLRVASDPLDFLESEESFTLHELAMSEPISSRNEPSGNGCVDASPQRDIHNLIIASEEGISTYCASKRPISSKQHAKDELGASKSAESPSISVDALLSVIKDETMLRYAVEERLAESEHNFQEFKTSAVIEIDTLRLENARLMGRVRRLESTNPDFSEYCNLCEMEVRRLEVELSALRSRNIKLELRDFPSWSPHFERLQHLEHENQKLQQECFNLRKAERRFISREKIAAATVNKLSKRLESAERRAKESR